MSRHHDIDNFDRHFSLSKYLSLCYGEVSGEVIEIPWTIWVSVEILCIVFFLGSWLSSGLQLELFIFIGT